MTHIPRDKPDDALATSIIQHGHLHSLQDIVAHTVVRIQILQIGQEHAVICRLLITNALGGNVLCFIMREQEEESVVELRECGLVVIHEETPDYVFHLFIHIESSNGPLEALLNATVHKRQDALRFPCHRFIFVVVARRK